MKLPTILAGATLLWCVFSLQAQTETFNFTGEVQTYIVPSCVTSIEVVAAGAQGGGTNSGNGSTVTAILTVVPGDVLEIYVGGQGGCPAAGFNGGGLGTTAAGAGNEGCGGGGASDVRTAPFGIADRLIVAAGGGGMGGGDTDAFGGTGGCETGGIGDSPFGQGGGGASQFSGGVGGPSWIGSGTPGQPGSLGLGGNGALDPCFNVGPGGGGGGGFYGGGGGGSDCFSSSPLGGGGGGGGSSFTPAGGSCAPANQTGNGFVTITPVGGGMDLTIQPTTPAICEGESVEITVSGGVNYTWNPAVGLNITTGATVIASPLSTQSYEVYVNDGDACFDTLFVTVSVIPTPVLAVEPSAASICLGESIELSVSGADDFGWSPAEGLSTTVGNEVVASPENTQTYTITGSTNGCVGDTTITITVNALPEITVSPENVVICPGDSVNLTGVGGSTYEWSPASGLSSSTGETVIASPFQSTTYIVTGVSNEGCSDSASVQVEVSPLPIVSAGPDQTICEGEEVTLNGSGVADVDFNWTPAADLSNPNIDSPTANPATTTEYILTITDQNGCTNSDSTTVFVVPFPEISIEPVEATICEGESVDLIATGADSYLWTPISGLNVTIGSEVTASPSSTQTYTVTGETEGCEGEASITILVNDLPTITASPENPIICPGESVSLTASGGSTYSWSPQSGLNNTTGENVIASPSETTTYTVEGTDDNGCTSTTSLTVLVSDLPLANAGPDQTLCSGSSTVLFGAGPFGAEFSWSPSEGLDDPNTAMPVASPGATTTYTLTVTDVNGCTNTDEVTITTITVVADFFADPETGNAPIDITFDNNSSNASFFEWDYGDGNTENTTLAITENSYEENGNFLVTLIAIGPNGCSDTTTITIVLQEPFFLMIPNIFTPNGDGMNEFFELDVRGVSSIEVNVYNRWGTLMHTHSGVNGQWDGTNNGVRCADGVYFYTVILTTLEGEQQKHNGTITLLR